MPHKPSDTADIPTFPEFAPLSLSHKKIFSDVFAALRPENSEFCFGYLFSWRRPLALAASVLENRIIVKGRLYGEDFIFAPIEVASDGRADPASSAKFLAKTLILCRHEKILDSPRVICAAKALADAVLNARVADTDVISEADYFDYVYCARDLSELSGDKYQSKRNFVNRFAKKYRFDYKLLDTETAALCLGLQNKWRDMKLYDAPPSILDEDTAAKELLANFDSLDLCGCAIFVDGVVAAFSVGERLNDETLVMHLEKADTSFAGAYQTMSRLSAQTAVEMGYTYINKEEDLGLANLRKAKTSYYPAKMVSKYEIRQKV
jgi:hypothetical protein